MKLSVIGLGKLGLCTAACFAANGHKVYGYDKDPRAMELLSARQASIDETGIDELLERAWDNLVFCSSTAEAVAASDITLIVVPTPSMDDGKFTNEYVEKVLDEIGPALKAKESFHIVDVVSTVMPGSSRNAFLPRLERLTGKRCGEGFGLVYNPEFIALGSVIWNFLNPDMVLIGASDPRSGETVKELYASTCENQPEIAVMALESAEIAKLSLNCYVTMKISFVNELSSLCERMPNADVDDITSAIGADTRVGGKYLRAGLGFGGPCFPRDNLAFQAFARSVEREVGLGPQVVKINHRVVDRLLEKVKRASAAGDKVALLGVSYKPNTHVVEESQGIQLAQSLVDAGYKVSLHDPKALDEARRQLGDSVDYCDDPYECVEGANVIALLTPWSQFTDLSWERVAQRAAGGATLLDGWRAVPEAANHLGYDALGRSA